LQSDSGTMFIERSLVSDITAQPRYRRAVPWKSPDGILNYARAFSMLSDGSMSSGIDTDDEKSSPDGFSPFHFNPRAETTAKTGIGVGGSFAAGRVGVAAVRQRIPHRSPAAVLTYRTSTTATNPNVISHGDHWTHFATILMVLRPVERDWGVRDFIAATAPERHRVLAHDQDRAWQVSAGCVLTGEDSSDHGVVRCTIRSHQNSWGALESLAGILHSAWTTARSRSLPTQQSPPRKRRMVLWLQLVPE